MRPLNVFFFPFAGASKYAYRSFQSQASLYDINVIPIELPGRNTRVNEKALVQMEAMVTDVFEQIKHQLTLRYAFYGHSMGSLLGYLVARLIVKKGLPPPVHLFFSGSGGPAVKEENLKRYALPKAEFLQELSDMGGVPQEILHNDALMDFFEPILRADFTAIDTHRHQAAGPLTLPITCLIGSEDKVTEEQALAWQQETTVGLEIIRFPGNHFFIFGHESDILKIIKQRSTLIPV